MKLILENLGYIKKAEIETKPLTIICGKNNTGKTYLSYAIYGLLRFVQQFSPLHVEREVLESLRQKGAATQDLSKYVQHGSLSETFERLSDQFTQRISRIFGGPEDAFSATRITLPTGHFNPDFSPPLKAVWQISQKSKLSVTKQAGASIVEITIISEENTPPPAPFLIEAYLKQAFFTIIFNDYFRNPFIVTSERTGIQLFRNELDQQKNIIIYNLLEDKGKQIDRLNLLNRSISRLPIPINDNINNFRDKEGIKKSNSFLVKSPQKNKHLFEVWNELLGGKLIMLDDQIIFVPNEQMNHKPIQVPLYLASSSVKSLTDFDLYLSHIAHPYDLLMIDEPELSLHPDNQRRMARILAQLVSNGIHVFLTTHSDYFLKEINNLVLLNGKFPGKKEIMKKYGYSDCETLPPKDLAVYIARDHTAGLVPVTKDGIQKSVFDEVIIDQNDASNEIFYARGK